MILRALQIIPARMNLSKVRHVHSFYLYIYRIFLHQAELQESRAYVLSRAFLLSLLAVIERPIIRHSHCFAFL